MYYASPSALIILGPIAGSSVLNYVRSHGNPIDIADGGDSTFRKGVYEAIWNIF